MQRSNQPRKDILSFIPSCCISSATNSTQFSLCTLNKMQNFLFLKREWPFKDFQNSKAILRGFPRVQSSKEFINLDIFGMTRQSKDALNHSTQSQPYFKMTMKQSMLTQIHNNQYYLWVPGTLPIFLTYKRFSDQKTVKHIIKCLS